jgi:transposase-like protein
MVLGGAMFSPRRRSPSGNLPGMRLYSREFRMQAVRRVLNGEKVTALSEELGIHRKLLYEWVRRVKEGGESNLRERGRPRKREAAQQAGPHGIVVKLKKTIDRQQVAIEFLQACLMCARTGRPRDDEWREIIFQTIQSTAHHPNALTVETMCELALVARSGYYRFLRARGINITTSPDRQILEGAG